MDRILNSRILSLDRDQALKTSTGLTHFLCAFVVFGMIAAAGQPIVADDAWLHLALGSLYSAHGAPLSSEPFLHTANSAPAAHGWLADITLDHLAGLVGFTGLRVCHAAFVAWILILVWRIARQVCQSPIAASLIVATFTTLSAYRLVQLRPQLFSIWAVLMLYMVLLQESSRRDLWALGGVACLSAAWANIHAGFVLGPIFIAAALTSMLCLALVSTGSPRRRALHRARHLSLLLLIAVLASCLNPGGPAQFFLYFDAGEATAALSQVGDEWAVFPFSGWPGGNFPPTPAAWTIAMLIFFLTPPVVAVESFRRIQNARSRGDESEESASFPTIDPGLLAIAAASLFAMATAVRFLWLGVFPLCVIAIAVRRTSAQKELSALSRRLIAALSACALLVAFYQVGPWSIVGQFTIAGRASYSRAYPPERYSGHAVWFLRDTRLVGRAFNPYYLGNFLAYWTMPSLRVFVNGSLAMSNEVVEDSRRINAFRATRRGESATAALDRYGVDVFMGVGLPDAPRARRPWHYSTTHLDDNPAWILVYRNLNSAVFLRRNARNQHNLARVEAHYRSRGVPFDRERGFEPARVIRGAPNWAVAQGLIPPDFRRLTAAATPSANSRHGNRARERLASIYLALGLYDRALEIEPKIDETSPNLRALRRHVWTLLRMNRWDDAARAARALETAATESDRISLGIVDTALNAANLPEEETRARIARLPLFERREAAILNSSIAVPEVRSARRDISLDPGTGSAGSESKGSISSPSSDD